MSCVELGLSFLLWDQEQFRTDQGPGSVCDLFVTALSTCYLSASPKLHFRMCHLWVLPRCFPKAASFPPPLPLPLLHRTLNVLWSWTWPLTLCSCIMLMKWLTDHQNYQSGFMEHMAFKCRLSGQQESSTSNEKTEKVFQREKCFGWMWELEENQKSTSAVNMCVRSVTASTSPLSRALEKPAVTCTHTPGALPRAIPNHFFYV